MGLEQSQKPQRFDTLPTPRDVAAFYAPQEQISPQKAASLAKKFDGTVINEALEAAKQPEEENIPVVEVIDELKKRLGFNPNRIHVSLVEPSPHYPHPTGVLSWHRYQNGEKIQYGNLYHVMRDNSWEEASVPVPDDIKQAAFAVRADVASLLKMQIFNDVDVVFVPNLQEGEFILEQEQIEEVRTKYIQEYNIYNGSDEGETRYSYTVNSPDKGEVMDLQYTFFGDAKKREILFQHIMDFRDAEGNTLRRVRSELPIESHWIMPDTKAHSISYFDYPSKRPTDYSDSIYRFARRTIYAPIPSQLQHYF